MSKPPRKIFYKRVSFPVKVQDAFRPNPYRSWLQHQVTRLAHAVLKRWGLPIMSEDTRIDQDACVTTLPDPTSILNRVRDEVDRRMRSHLLHGDQLVLVVGDGVPHEIEAAMAGLGRFDIQWRGGRPEAPYFYRVFGIPVVVTSWLEPDSFVVLPREALWDALRG